MEALPLFVVQFLWFFAAWSVVAYFVVWPWSLRLATNDRLALWVAPEMFRILGLGLLVPALSPGMPAAFAVPTAVADSATAGLAMGAFVALRLGLPSARALTWACMVIGIADLLIAFPHAAQTGAIAHLATQWYVPVFAGPLMVVAHIACVVTLLQTSREE